MAFGLCYNCKISDFRPYAFIKHQQNGKTEQNKRNMVYASHLMEALSRRMHNKSYPKNKKDACSKIIGRPYNYYEDRVEKIGK